MKKLTALLLLMLSLLFLSTISCKDGDDTSTNPIDQLPPATQTGENTFGCLLDGESFIPSGGTNPLDCVYQFVNGGYYFGLQGNKRNENNNRILLGISTNNLEIEENKTYALAGLFRYTSTEHLGEVTITKLDTVNQIVSGTFWFDIAHPVTGEIVEIREGRFDMPYSK